MRIIIAGAGSVGRQVLQDLTEAGGNEIVVVDTDEALSESLADRFDALVINGDAADPDVLEEAQVRRADALVAATGSDAINTVIAMLGHRFDVQRIVVKLVSNALRGALEEIGVSDIVAPTMAAAARIEAALHGDERVDLFSMTQGRLQMAELTVGPAGGGRAAGDLGIPGEAALVALVRGSEASLPRREDRLEEGDILVVVAETEEALETCRSRIEGA